MARPALLFFCFFASTLFPIFTNASNGFEMDNDHLFEDVLNEYTTPKPTYTQGSYMQELYAYSLRSMERYDWLTYIRNNKRKLIIYFNIKQCRREGVRFPHPLRCDLFKECLKIGDAPIDKECPGNTLFDPKKVRCLPQNQVGCDNRDIPVSKIEFPFWDQFDHGCPWGLVDQNPQQSMFAIRGNCTHYVHCTSDIRGNVMKCPAHTFYNPSQGACVDAKDSVRMDCNIIKRIHDASVLQMLRNK